MENDLSEAAWHIILRGPQPLSVVSGGLSFPSTKPEGVAGLSWFLVPNQVMFWDRPSKVLVWSCPLGRPSRVRLLRDRPSIGRPSIGRLPLDRPNFCVFFLSLPPPFSLFFLSLSLSLWGLLKEFWCFEAPVSTLGVLALLCESPKGWQVRQLHSPRILRIRLSAMCSNLR